ncbi:hypothetical protein KIW84_074042 [Lathyrus oleraceus]|uniref:DUF8040 domain-containing protein n=1 Tax=Pisum sativum TaxID=3888 RepID=A0A9D4VT29_PEA|nr:hypothetical protein KIW84_074042 [Pisum sativum]
MVEKNCLYDSRDVLVEEKVATFLFIIGHNVHHRVASIRFQHSTETISRNFKEVLRAVCRFGKELIKQESKELPERIKNNSKYYHWFKNCIGAIDGTHISASVPAKKQILCRDRKATITQNVMCACDFNMMLRMYIRDGKEVHMIQRFFWMQLQIKMLNFLGHLEVSHGINIKLCSMHLTKLN